MTWFKNQTTCVGAKVMKWVMKCSHLFFWPQWWPLTIAMPDMTLVTFTLGHTWVIWICKDLEGMGYFWWKGVWKSNNVSKTPFFNSLPQFVPYLLKWLKSSWNTVNRFQYFGWHWPYHLDHYYFWTDSRNFQLILAHSYFAIAMLSDPTR